MQFTENTVAPSCDKLTPETQKPNTAKSRKRN